MTSPIFQIHAAFCGCILQLGNENDTIKIDTITGEPVINLVKQIIVCETHHKDNVMNELKKEP